MCKGKRRERVKKKKKTNTVQLTNGNRNVIGPGKEHGLVENGRWGKGLETIQGRDNF